jgi:microcompartment protein CcmK/EutM
MVSTIKHDSLEGRRLLLVRPVTPEGEPTGRAEIALDTVDAGVGDRVLVTQEGHAGEAIIGRKGIPVRSLITAVVDQVEVGGRVTYRKEEDR